MKLTDCYQTPKELFNEVSEAVGGIWWDACCTQENCLVEDQKSYDIMYPFKGKSEYDYLETDLLPIWNEKYHPHELPKCNDHIEDTIFMNPPYSDPEKFMRKAWEDSKYFRVVSLVKADMSTDWFNFALEESQNHAVSKHQLTGTITKRLKDVIKDMSICDCCELSMQNPAEVGILYLRKRIKFYASEEMLKQDAIENPGVNHKNIKLKCGHAHGGYKGESLDIIETKNFKRTEKGIIAKSSGTFPSCLIVYDRRHTNGD